MIGITESTVIRKVRIRTTASDRLAAQQKLERALRATSLRPASLPRDAIFIVQHITTRPVGTAGWVQAVRARLDQLVREAVRPINDTVPANAQAVIFLDRSELLACLAADWCSGEVVMHWWWQILLSHIEVADVVIKVWLQSPECIPMALQWLEVKHSSVPFVWKLSDKGAHQMMDKLVQTYGLYELLPFINQDTTNHPVGKLSAEKSVRTKLIDEISNSGSRVYAPWQRWIQDSSADRLSSDRQLLLGVGLMLQHAPSIVRTASFARQVKDWQSSVNYFQFNETVFESQGPAQLTENFLTDSTVTFAAKSEIMSPSTVDPCSGTIENLSVNHADVEAGESHLDVSTEFSPIDAKSEIVSRPTVDQISPSKENIPLTYMHIDASEKREGASAEPSPMIENSTIEIESQFGGICYFINLGLYLDLYGDFTRPLQPGIDLPIWDFVALIAQQIVGDEVTHDPIWSLLAQLAGRAEDEPPGAHFDPPWHRSLRVWLDGLMLTLRPRLQSALGVDIEELPRFFTQPARIVVTPTCLDVYFALADLPIEIRLSGLDRDPGWVPAAGKFIGFHYE